MVHVEEVMGTVVSFHLVPAPGALKAAGEAVGEACRRLHELDDMLSTWKPHSPLSRLRRGEMPLEEAPAEVPEVLALCGHVKALSGGWFDPWAMPGGVDPTGLVKGWAVEGALEPLRRAGALSAMVNGGGDIALHGAAPDGGPWRVGIRHPWRPEGLACVLEVSGGAVATSGTYERGAHLVDPRSSRPAPAAASATVTGPSLAVADGLATALCVGGREVLAMVRDIAGYAAYLVEGDGNEVWTEGIVFG
jgi:thiamine biosynthesis lipoprotein